MLISKGKILKNGIKYKKKIKAIIFMIVFMMCGLELVYEQNTYVFADSLESDISYGEYISIMFREI